MMHNYHVGHSPRYIIDTLSPIADLRNRGRLRSSASSKYELPALRLEIGKQAFSHSEPESLLEQPAERTNIYYGHSNFKISSKNSSIQTCYDC